MFNSFRSHLDGDNILESPLISVLTNFIKFYNGKHPEKNVRLFTTLKRFNDDEGMTKIIEAGMKTPSTRDLAQKLQTEQIQPWTSDKLVLYEVFALLKIQEGRGNILASPLLNTSTRYLDTYNKRKPDRKPSLFRTLREIYKESGTVRVIDEALKDPNTVNLGRKLEAAQSEAWLNMGETPDYVFRILRFDIQDDLFSAPQFNSWVKYSDDFQSKYPKTTMISRLRNYFGDFSLANKIQAAKNSLGTESASTKDLFKLWADKYTPEKMFTRLRLHKEKDKLLESPLFSFWTRYVDDYSKVRAGSQMTVVSALTYNFNDDILLRVLDKAKNVPRTEKLVTKLLTDLLQHWLSIGNTPVHAFRTMILSREVDNFLTVPQLSTWVKYLQDFNKAYPSRKTTMIDTFRAYFSDEKLSKLLVEAKEIPSLKAMATNLENAL
ncbi:hypothetical protein PHYPSEUDO_014401 [Phytophthora pseudosyringae]|uniref:RxLR effector protein n=1 Tax=Phytophthora pseudosyringae TaxID=221518 RepID=A0A8T1V776_9STRA|nr:hypothetical protein PHYPSEUDO_014401 [Phytophthora pseudosyringae]